ncbi:hypothetical protein [Mycobacterium sp. URHB0044]|jgi:hypothetical protein|uniref:hypothetical protein n=1 Tax=Mycobacterium sp. URHB0044 TaxID=1380386 RepID=UPI00048E6656|nr:hypothetical protein [Mycobacterium sp. URHB0044]
MRWLLIVVGVVIGGYGGVLLLDNPPVIIMRILVWAVVAAVVHDFVFAPVGAAMGFTGRRLIRSRWWAPVTVAALCTVVLVLLAIPVYAKPGLRPDNLTVLNRDYPLGLWVSVTVVWACVPLYYLITRLLPVRQDQVVEREGADDVGGQPPAV